MQIIWNYDAAPAFRATLATLAQQGLQVSVCPAADDRRLFELLAEAEVLWHCLRPVDAKLLNAAPRLRLVQKIGVGVNTIDLELARQRSIAVCNMPGTNSRAVAEHTLGLMLTVLRQICRFDADTRAGQGWRWNPDRQDALGEIAGRTVGLVGYGQVPALLTPILHAMGARVLYTARTPKPHTTATYCSLEQLLAQSDIVSLHLPLTTATERLINATRLALCRTGAILINTARGQLIDEAALLAALQSGQLAGAGLDVFTAEPLPATHPLYALPNVVLTPHTAWLTQETLARSLSVAIDNCRRLAAGAPLAFRIV
jgi:phosphoglycerate dehydrogenase-like enzyme